jgi:hypothetical protein
MPLCVNCYHPVPSLYTEYGEKNTFGNSKATTAFALTHCSNCNKVADHYIEFEPIIFVLDLLLQRPSIYVHLLFNSKDFGSLRRNILKLGIFIWCMDVYLKLVLHDRMQDLVLETLKQDSVVKPDRVLYQSTYFGSIIGPLVNIFLPNLISEIRLDTFYLFSSPYTIFKYSIYLFCMSFLEHLVFLAAPVLIAAIHFPNEMRDRSISMPIWLCVTFGLLLGGFGKIFLSLMVIWSYNEAFYVWILCLFVCISQGVALGVCLNGFTCIYRSSNQRKRNIYRIQILSILLATLSRYLFQCMVQAFLDPNYPITL